MNSKTGLILVVGIVGFVLYSLFKGQTTVQAAGTTSIAANPATGLAAGLSNLFGNLEATTIGSQIAGPGQTAGTDNSLGTGFLEEQQTGTATGVAIDGIGDYVTGAAPVVSVTPDSTDYLSSIIDQTAIAAPVDATATLSYP